MTFLIGFYPYLAFSKEESKKQGKTEEQILEEINSYPIPGWLSLRVRGYIGNVDFETIESADLSKQ